MPNRPIDDLAINTIRALAMDAVQKAGSGHPGTAMGMAPMAYTLWTRFLRFNPRNPDWPGRDRFVLSAGHASILQYTMLHLTGYDLPLEEIKRQRQWGSRTPGHPEHGHTPGVELTTGPLGAGFAMGVGMAMAARFLGAKFNRPEHDLVDHRIYGFVSDGDLMEGVASEAASLAGTLGLGQLIYLYDANQITIDGDTGQTFREDVGKRFEAYGWHVQHVVDHTAVEEIAAAIDAARAELARPSLIIVPTVIAYGSPNKAGTAAAHGSPLGAEEVALTKQALGWPAEPAFYIPDEVLTEMRRAVDRGARLEQEWHAKVDAYERAFPDDARTWRDALERRLPEGWAATLPVFTEGGSMATRQASGKAVNALAAVLPTFLGGSADLAESNLTNIDGDSSMSAENPGGRIIRFGVREHAMGNAVNGMALHGGVIPFGATFLIFSDYMRPALRLAAIQQARGVLIFTHDSIGLGADGPTHQPVEHLMSLRAMPQMTVLRPADANETSVSWRIAIERGGPVALVLSRQNLPVLPDIELIRDGVPRGAYVLAEADGGAPDLVMLATGSEVSLALEARAVMQQRGQAVRVVSMPSWELFAEQSEDYRAQVLLRDVPRMSVEAGATLGWERWVGDGEIVGLDRFGASADGGEVMAHLGFNTDAVVERAEALLARSGRPAGAGRR